MKQQPFNPINYIKTRARTLPIFKCYINENWKEKGMASITVIRKHTNGNFTFGVYLVDLFAMGTKDTFFNFNVDDDAINSLIKPMDDDNIIEIEYVLAHNIIYGANAFAEDHSFKIHKDFAISQFILEADTEDTELIEIEFGLNGEPFLIKDND